ncbi:DUF421 domain-containing protein [Bailinhaonella thermotolerans]|uniref:DUF421 domain-containing protein n=1 Tax=Bailinhaonella thermotolerans TaxID=1070861 RepID=A0A3A4A2N5_9ACTN|nr:YetF domain-containing protein [Bailinhaonella thermotolerans]RJL21730.1 DUF421 domain-containing protein [Bailinhaonella thermotolerans]
MEWDKIFAFDTPPLEIVIRGTVVYLALFFLLRLTFKREVGELDMGNLLVIVLVADAAQNAMSGSYESIADGLLLVVTIGAWSIVLDAMAYRWSWAHRLMRPKPQLLIEKGRVRQRALRRELMTRDELRYELRQRGVEDVSQVKAAFMEPDGQMSVLRYDGEDEGDSGGRKRRAV